MEDSEPMYRLVIPEDAYRRLPEVFKVDMYYRDHLPPHVHAIYNEYEALIDIETLEVLLGDLPQEKRLIVEKMMADSRAYLLRLWSELNPREESIFEALHMERTTGVPRIAEIIGISGYRLTCQFKNGERRVIDFEHLFRDVFNVRPGDVEFALLEDPSCFAALHFDGSNLSWPGVGVHSKDEHGNPVFYPYELDPVILYAHSGVDRIA